MIGAVRITYGTGTLDARVRRMWTQLVLLCLGVLVAVAIVGFVLARSITRPIRRLQSATDQFATGDLSARVETDTGPPELRQLATTVQSHGQPAWHDCSTRSNASSRMPRTSCAHRSPRCGCASRTSPATSTTATAPRSTPRPQRSRA